MTLKASAGLVGQRARARKALLREVLHQFMHLKGPRPSHLHASVSDAFQGIRKPTLMSLIIGLHAVVFRPLVILLDIVRNGR